MKRIWYLSLLIAAALSTPAAHAANAVPNPGFETDCAGVPCNWATNGNATVARDTLPAFTPEAGAASMRLTAGSSSSLSGAIGACFLLGAGDHVASFWFNYLDSRVASVSVALLTYSTTTCSGVQLNPQTSITGILGDGTWRQATGVLTAPAGTLAARIAPILSCQTVSTCAGGETAHFDDLVLDSTITPVSFRSLSASAKARGTLVRWSTGSEIDTLGFNVYREVSGRRIRINMRLIAAQNGDRGRAYSFLDRSAPRTKPARYWIQVVNLDGSRAWYGPARVAKGTRG